MRLVISSTINQGVSQLDLVDSDRFDLNFGKKS